MEILYFSKNIVNYGKFQVHLIDFDDESNVINKNVFMHSAGEIWSVFYCLLSLLFIICSLSV